MNKNDKRLKQILLDSVGYKNDEELLKRGLKYLGTSNQDSCRFTIVNSKYRIVTPMSKNKKHCTEFDFMRTEINKETGEESFLFKLVDYNSNFYVLFCENYEPQSLYPYYLDICSYEDGAFMNIIYDTDINQFMLNTENDLESLIGTRWSLKHINLLLTGLLPTIYKYLLNCNTLLEKYESEGEK